MAATCPGYNPKFQPQLVSTDPLGGVNCTCYSGAMACDDHSCGTKVPTGKRVRELTGDRSGGTNLAQVDDVLRTNYGVDLDTRYRYPWTEFAKRIEGGASAILQGGYSVIKATSFRGSETFSGNHAIFVPHGWAVMDPLCDGRRAGIYKFHGQPYPTDLIRRFAGHLNMEGRSGYPPKYLGDGLVYASFTRDNEPASYRAVMAAGLLDWWRVVTVSGSLTAERYIRQVKTGGFAASCTPPRLYKWPGHSNVSLVKITSGSAAGRYLATYAPRLTLQTAAGVVEGPDGEFDEADAKRGDIEQPDPDLDMPEPVNDAVAE